MLDKILLSRFHQLVEVKFVERKKLFPIDLTQINSRASLQGAFHSGSRIRQIHQAYVSELEIRAILAWESLIRVHKTLGCCFTETLRADLKEEMKCVVGKIHMELGHSLQEYLAPTQQASSLSLDDANNNTMKKHEIEADLYVDSIVTSQHQGDKSPMAQHYNFYGHVGAVQTGANAVANTIQNLGAEDRATLAKAIEQVREALEVDTSLTFSQRKELLEISDECSIQLDSTSPNNTKLLSMFNILGTTIQSIASAQPAYQTLKAALIPLGIIFP